MADENTIERAMSGLGSTIYRAGQLIRKARVDFGSAHEPRQRILNAGLACLVACAVTALLLLPLAGGPALDYVEAPLRNTRVLRLEDPGQRDPDILIIAIDERALAYGDATDLGFARPAERYAWPWPRHVYNKLIRWCRQGGARVIAFDFVFSESGPNTNDPLTLVPRDNGTMQRVWTADKAGDDLFILEATARPDVVLALATDTRGRGRERRDELLARYASGVQGRDGLLVLPAIDGVRSISAPIAGLLDGKPTSTLMNDLDQLKPDEQRQEVAGYYRVLTRQSPAFEAPRFGSLLPTPPPTLRGVAGAGLVYALPDPADGVLRNALLAASHDGRNYRHFALETWRLWVLSYARQGHAAAAGLEVSGGRLAWDGTRYDLANELRDAPVKLHDGRLRYLGVDVPVDDAGNIHLRYRGLLPPEQDPVYLTGSEAVKDQVRQAYAEGTMVALYPTISAADVLRDWDAWDLQHGGWERRREELRRQIKAIEQDMEDFADDEAELAVLRERLKSVSQRLADIPPTPPKGWPKLTLGDPAGLVKDKVVMIAGSAAGLGDLHHTPFSRTTPGTYFVANVFDNVKNNDVMRLPSRAWDWLLAMAAAIAATLVVMFAGRVRNGLAVTVLLGVAVVVASMLFFRGQVWFPTAAPLAGLVLGFSHGALAKALTEGRQRRQREAFARQYMGKELVDYVIKNPGTLKLGGENRPMTIYFSDVAGFTTVTETLGPNNPERLVELLNVYLERMTDLMLETGGVIDKYIGDAIMCFWGAPMKMDDHAVRAVRGALKCRAELQRMQPLFADAVRTVAPQLIKPDGTVLYARAGINTGIVTVGNMGSSKRFAYTVMGDAVNLAARLEPQCKEYGTDILIGPKTAEAVRGEFTLRRIDLMVVKGKSEPTEVFEVLGDRDVPQFIHDLVAVYEKGVDLFRDRQFANALEVFRSAAKQEPNAGKNETTPSQLYIARCEELILHPPAGSFTGVYVKKTK
ncbi:MAG: adenylate/guanylate cyclase domain-containing protein [Planctomycetes bacterium]|nr:adenylate/guanylate cyclase domain-containing protein [Planctomycetota bacterium]